MENKYTYYTEGSNGIEPHELRIESEVHRISEAAWMENPTGNTEALYYIIRVFSENYNEYTQTFTPGAEWFEAMTEENIDGIIEMQIEAIRNQYKAV